jgi:hypothetical protein
VRGTRHGETATVTVGFRSAKVILQRDKAIERPVMRLWMRSFRSFNNPVVEMSLGQVQVRGNAKPASNDEMSGSVAVQAFAHEIPDNWISDTDRFLTFMLRGLAFAHGSRLQTPRCDLHIESRSEVTFYDGKAGQSGFPNIPFLAQEDCAPRPHSRRHGASLSAPPRRQGRSRLPQARTGKSLGQDAGRTAVSRTGDAT